MVSIPVALLHHSGAQGKLCWGAASASCGFISTLPLAVDSALTAVGGTHVPCLLSKGAAPNHLVSLSRSPPLPNSEISIQATGGESHAFLPKLLTEVPDIIVSVPSSFLAVPSCLLEQCQVIAWVEKSQEKHVNFSLIPRQRIFQQEGCHPCKAAQSLKRMRWKMSNSTSFRDYEAIITFKK